MTAEMNLARMSRQEKIELLETLEEIDRRQRFSKFDYLFPDEGRFSRKHYLKQMQFFELGTLHNQRALFGGNRSGKTLSGAFEMTCHLTGRYPAWWRGKRFHSPVRAWTAGDSAKSVRDIIQSTLLGPPGNEAEEGTGIIPKNLIVRKTPKHGLADAVESVFVRHVTGGVSVLQFKSYDQGRDAFQGTSQEVIHLDEECPEEIYTECLLRTMTVGGILYLTATPLLGLTALMLSFLPHLVPIGDGEVVASSNKAAVFVEWDDVPHLTKQMRDDILSGVPAWQRESRTKGIPQFGAGAIYQTSFDDMVEAPIVLPAHWPRCFAMDVGWKRNGAVFLAWDRDADTIHVYDEVYLGNVEPSINAAAIKARGEWMPGVIDPAARGRSQRDGSRLIEIYRELGLDILPANNAVEAGIYAVWERISTSRLKVFSHCKNFAAEYRLYRRDLKGNIVKQNDHLMDALRYGIMSALNRACVAPLLGPNGKQWWNKDFGSEVWGG